MILFIYIGLVVGFSAFDRIARNANLLYVYEFHTEKPIFSVVEKRAVFIFSFGFIRAWKSVLSVQCSIG